MKKIIKFCILIGIILTCIMMFAGCNGEKEILCDNVRYEYDSLHHSVKAKNDYEGSFVYTYKGVNYDSTIPPKEVGIYTVTISADGYTTKTVNLEIFTLLEINSNYQIIGYKGSSDTILIPNSINNNIIRDIENFDVNEKVKLIFSTNIENVNNLFLGDESIVEIFTENQIIFHKNCSLDNLEIYINPNSSFIADDFFVSNDNISRINIVSKIYNLNNGMQNSNVEVVLRDDAQINEELTQDINLTIIVDKDLDKFIKTPQPLLTELKLIAFSSMELNSIYLFSSIKDLTIEGPISVYDRNQVLNGAKLIISKNTKEITDRAFSTINFAKIELPDSLESIGKDAFSFNELIEEISIPNGINKISSHLFSNCTNLTTINFGHNITSIGDNAFIGTAIKEFVMPSSVTSIGEGAFNSTAIKEFVMPSSVTSIGKYAFANSDIEKYTDLTSLSTLPENMFSFCTNLKSVKLNENIKVIDAYAFYNCSSLIYTLPAGLEEIKDYAFTNCEKINELELPKNLSVIGIGAIPSFTNIINSSHHFVKADNFLLTLDRKILVHFYSVSPTGIIEIPSGIETINDRVFLSAYHYMIKIPPTLKEISNKSFNILGHIIISDSITQLINLKEISPFNITFESEEPPNLGDNEQFFQKITKIIVPENSYDRYIEAFKIFPHYENIINKIVSPMA